MQSPIDPHQPLTPEQGAALVTLARQTLAGHFGDGTLRAPDLVSGLVGAVVKDPVQDRLVLDEYLETVNRSDAVIILGGPGYQPGFPCGAHCFRMRGRNNYHADQASRGIP